MNAKNRDLNAKVEALEKILKQPTRDMETQTLRQSARFQLPERERMTITNERIRNMFNMCRS